MDYTVQGTANQIRATWDILDRTVAYVSCTLLLSSTKGGKEIAGSLCHLQCMGQDCSICKLHSIVVLNERWKGNSWGSCVTWDILGRTCDQAAL